MIYRQIRPERISAMKRGFSSRLTYANVMSTVAVFLALGGGSLAATNKGSGDNGGQHQNAGNGDKTNKGDGNGNGHKGRNDHSGNGSGGNSSGGDDNSGGDSSSTDNTGASGSPQVTFTTRHGESVLTDPKSDSTVADAACDKDEAVVGGGVRTTRDGRGAQPLVESSGPDGNGWTATVQNNSGADEVKVTAYAICASSH